MDWVSIHLKKWSCPIGSQNKFPGSIMVRLHHFGPLYSEVSQASKCIFCSGSLVSGTVLNLNCNESVFDRVLNVTMKMYSSDSTFKLPPISVDFLLPACALQLWISAFHLCFWLLYHARCIAGYTRNRSAECEVVCMSGSQAASSNIGQAFDSLWTGMLWTGTS